MTVRTTVVCGFALLTVASLGLLAIDARTPLALAALLPSARSVSIGLVISPLLAAFTGPLAPEQLADGTTLQHLAAHCRIPRLGLIASVFAQQSLSAGPVAALHAVAILVTVIAAAGLVIAPFLRPLAPVR
jgi:hypothetical protein